MQDVHSHERRLSEREPAEQELCRPLPDDRGRERHLDADLCRPEGQLLPREDVPGEPEEQRQRDEDDAEHPVDLTRLLVRPGEVHAEHVQEHRRRHELGGPLVDRPEHEAELDVGHDQYERVVRGGRVALRGCARG